MKQIAPVLMVFGLGLMAGGFSYDLTFAGLPYQDATAEMAARWALDKSIGEGLFIAGFALLIAGLLGWVVRRFGLFLPRR
jgi:hypothetical protein